MTVSARIFVNEGTFGILDAGEVPIETADWSQSLLVPMAQGAIVLTGINTGHVTVQVDAIPQQGDVDNGGWEENARARLWAPTGGLRVESLVHGAHESLSLLSEAGPGWYEVEIKARGRHFEPDGTNLESAEAYLISAWPSSDTLPPSNTASPSLQADDTEADDQQQRLLRGGAAM
ncbi:hypothetical protein OTB20_25380 [Streptomyces sp. H27-H1]|uniref:hypothetical protein n=1 Tax=unclassified Streptomyces TaxID=2593676 RepID=UPI0022708D1E|nr:MULTISPECIES: hypothetical protein [unclassified Streptomyces]MCY0929472.1 hypothetical protein [Streptomyces sp. H27-H1]MCY0938312.1 hypothetical protein [Streptomyces sp. H34-S4]